MSGRGLSKYIVTSLHNMAKLREDDLARLVLECIGRFYVQGTTAYIKDSYMTPAREAAILTMEYFLIIGSQVKKMEAEVKEEAETGAIARRKTGIWEGGISRAFEIDARGCLFLFEACYGIPTVFKNEEIWNLMRLSDLRRIADVCIDVLQKAIFHRRVYATAPECVHLRACYRITLVLIWQHCCGSDIRGNMEVYSLFNLISNKSNQ